MKGMRVQSIIRELRGEKIDIIPTTKRRLLLRRSPEPGQSDAACRSSIRRPRNSEVIVEGFPLSLAIGKKGQNVRLASKLIGWTSTSRAKRRSVARSKSR